MSIDQAAAAAPSVSDEDIRDWARATGRKVGERGRVSPTLRTEYEKLAGELGVPAGDQTAAAPPPASGGAAASQPRRGRTQAAEPARAGSGERRPRPVPQPRGGALSRVKAWFSGEAAGPKGRAPKPPGVRRDRTPLTRLATRGWENLGRLAEHVNVPVARTMAWQSPYVGVVFDDIVSATPLDKILQPIARAEQGLSGAAAIIAMPLLVGAITAERNDPNLHGAGAAMRQQMLHAALAESIDSQLEMFGDPRFAAKVRKSATETSERRGQVADIMAMLFAAAPGPVELSPDASAEEVAAAEAEAAAATQREAELRATVSALQYLTTLPVPEGPDPRDVAAAEAAAAMGESGNIAAAAMDAALAAAAR